MKRQRGRNRRSSGGQNNNINRHFESNGPDVKIRGSAQQVLEKYLQYAREAQTNGDRVKSEAYFQHAEHYQRTLAMMQAAQKPKRDRDETRGRDQDQDDDVEDADNEAAGTADDGAGKSGREDPLRVIGNDDGSGNSSDEGETSGETDAKPKRAKRRSYKTKADAETASKDGDADSDSDSDDEADGVMKTLSRGRKPARAKARQGGDEAADEAPEKAAAE